jgi:hypothetical protein
MRIQPRVLEFGYGVFVVVVLLLSLRLVSIQGAGGDWHDFDVFYGAAKAALAGNALHTITGKYALPFWYPPWIAWAFIPFAFFSRSVALFLYQAISLASALGSIHLLSRYHNPEIRILDECFMLAMAIPLSFQVLIVGQMEFIYLAVLVCIMFAAERQMHLLVAILFPFVLAKPHLVVLFTVFLFWRMGVRAALMSLAVIVLLLGTATVLRPNWPFEWLRVLQQSGIRTDGLPFTTLAGLLGRTENWLGSANLPISLALLAVGAALLWKVRSLPTVPLLSLALALSLLAAPRAYAYDLTLLIPALIWLTAARFRRSLWIWILAGLVPIIAVYGSACYLVTLMVCVLGGWRALADSGGLKGMLPKRQIGLS